MKYHVRRQDDHGNIFNASGWYENLANALRAKQRCEQYPHKQMYWIEDEEGRRVDEKLTGSKKRSAMELKHVWLISAIKDSEAI
jgi:hypothetical protein